MLDITEAMHIGWMRGRLGLAVANGLRRDGGGGGEPRGVIK